MSAFYESTYGSLLAIAIAIGGIWYGSEIVVSKAKALARCFGIKELIIGLTVVSIGTSLPEIFVNIASGQAEAPSVGVGNIIGSCFGQMTVILGLCILIGGPADVKKRSLRRDGSVLIGSILLLMLLGADGNYTKPEGFFLMALYIAYVSYLIYIGRNGIKLTEEEKVYCPPVPLKHMAALLLFFCAGLFIVYGSANLIVNRGIALGEQFGLPQVFIGVLSGLGTSIPELVVSLTALLKRSTSLSIGNLIGSNITDPLFSLGIGSAVGNYTFVYADFVPAFLFWLVGSSLAMFYLWSKLKIVRWEAASLMAVYGGYLWFVLAM